MSLEVGKEIGSKLGTFMEVDRRSWQSEQAKFMRVRVELEIEKPLRRGAYIVSSDEERLWLTFKYERLPTVCFICGKLGHDKKHCPAARDWQTACHQYGDWLRAGWNTKMAAKEKNQSTAFGRVFSGEANAQLLAEQGTGSASTSLQASGLVGGMSNLEKCDSWGRVNSTCADGNLAGEVQATRGPTELLKTAVTGQDLGALGSLETSRDQLKLVLSTDDSFSHRPKSLASQSPKGPLLQKSPNPKAPSEINEKDKSELMNAARATHVGLIFQAKAQGKGKQMLAKAI